MRIACPSCNAVYQVPDEQLGEGRVVRCVRCGTDWSPVVSDAGEQGEARPPDAVPEATPEAAPAGPPTPEAAPEPVRRMAIDDEPAVRVTPVAAAPTPSSRRGVPWLAVAWVASVLAVGGGVAGLVVWREAVMHGWPPSIRAYAGLGLAGR